MLFVVVAVLLTPLASSAPDGLEVAVMQTTLPKIDTSTGSLFAGYDKLLPGPGWETWSVVLSGLVGSLAVFGIALLLGRPLEQQPGRSARGSSD